MSLSTLLQHLHEEYEGFNPPGDALSLGELQKTAGAALPDDVIAMYADHDGSNRAPRSPSGSLHVRLLPAARAVEANRSISAAYDGQAMPGRPLWLWTDDNSNYAGVFLDGPLAAWVTVLNHEEPEHTPAFLSVASFLRHVLRMDQVPNETEMKGDREPPIDIPSIPREYPATKPRPEADRADLRLAVQFLDRYRIESDEDAKRTWAFTFLCLLPFANTDMAVPLLRDPDMWTPEKAVVLLELRRFGGAVSELERLAREGTANGDMAAMRALVRMKSHETAASIKRLELDFGERKRAALDMWRRGRLLPPQW